VTAPDGSIHCIVVTRETCEREGGDYRGDGTTCGNDTCGGEPARGACCIRSPAGVVCLVLTAEHCEREGGQYLGDGTSCNNQGCAPRADLNGDGHTGLEDLAVLLANFGRTSGMTFEQGDLDGDVDVDVADLSLLLSQFGA
jgi:hypothetical protein